MVRDAEGKPTYNLSGKGIRYVRDGTGSGFCVSRDGWIVTNRHVVDAPLSDDLKRLDLKTELSVWVVFNGQARRRTARVVMPSDTGVDLALLKTEPFPGMPWVQDFDLAAPVPPATAEVYLLGFPYGTDTLQQWNDAVSASIFRGIVSRQVQGYLQVTAGVYPGNSGGPLVDESGRVVGIVTAVQRNPDGTGFASNIGFAIPVADARAIWPPRE